MNPDCDHTLNGLPLGILLLITKGYLGTFKIPTVNQRRVLHVENSMESTRSPTELLVIRCLESNNDGQTLCDILEVIGSERWPLACNGCASPCLIVNPRMSTAAF